MTEFPKPKRATTVAGEQPAPIPLFPAVRLLVGSQPGQVTLAELANTQVPTPPRETICHYQQPLPDGTFLCGALDIIASVSRRIQQPGDGEIMAEITERAQDIMRAGGVSGADAQRRCTVVDNLRNCNASHKRAY